MSRTVEQKVVEMRFDNSNFEKNVSQSMDSLNRLKATIDKTSSGNAFTGLSKALDNINIGSVTTAIQTVTEKFSVWEQVAIGAARNIGASISNYVVKGMNDMVFRNISAGWDKYATKTEAVQTIMASIADQDFGNVDKMEYVEGLMEKLNWFTDETSFHLTDMISSIGKFTSAGVDLDKASDAMMGIATWAAVSGANADTASRVMYQLSQSLGLGAVRTQDWMSVETANMATKEFKELAIQVAKTKKTLTEKGVTAKGNKVNFQNFRENLKDNWLTSDVLTETLAQYSGFANALNRVYEAYGGNVPTSTLIKRFKLVQAEAKKTGKSLKETFKEKYDVDVNFDITDKEGKVIGDLTKSITELGMRAFIAAQEAKTFKEAMDSVGDAASTVWMRVYETIFGNYEVAKELWTNLANDLYELFVEPIWIASDLFEEWSKQGGRALLFGRQILENDDGTEEIVPTGAFDIFIRGVIDASNALRNGFLTALGYSEDKVSEFTTKTLMKFSQKMLNLSKRFQKFIGNVDDLTEKFSKFFGFFVDIINSIDVFNKRSDESVDILGQLKSTFESTFGFAEALFGRLGKVINLVKEAFMAFFGNLKLTEGRTMTNLENTVENLGEIARDLYFALIPVIDIFKKIVDVAKKAGKFISGVSELGTMVIERIINIVRNTNLLSDSASALNNILERVKTGFNAAFDSQLFEDIKQGFYDAFGGIKTFIDGFKLNEGVYEKIETASKGVASAINLVGKAIKFALNFVNKLIDTDIFTELGKFLSGTVLNALLSIPATIGKIITKIDEFISTHSEVKDILDGITTIFDSLIKFVLNAANAFSDFIAKTKPLSKVGGFIKSIFDKFKGAEKAADTTNKISEAFDNVVAFFRDSFYFDNFIEKVKEVGVKVEELELKIEDRFSKIKAKFNELSETIKEFFKVLDDKYKVTQHFEELWNNIKKLFAREDDFEGFGANFMSGFAKGLIDNVDIAIDKIKEVGAKVLQAIKDFFGIHSPSTVMEEVGEDLISGFTKGIKESIDKPLEAIKKLAGNAFKGLTSLLFGSGGVSGGVASAEKDVKESTSASETIKKSLGSFARNLLGISAIALPTIATIKVSRIFHTLMSPFEALESITEAFTWRAKGEVIVNGITALGKSLKEILLALGGFLVMIAAAGAILAVADKYTEGGVVGPMFAMVGLITEVLTMVSALATTLAKIGTKSSVSASAKTKRINLIKNETTEYIEAIGDIFLQIGSAMLLLAASVAALAYVSKEFGGDNLANAFGILVSFLGVLGLAGYFIGKFSTGETKSGIKIDKKGINLTHKGYTEAFYAIGTFMLEVGVAMAAMALSAAIVVKACDGDIDKMHEAFQGMMGIMGIAIAGMVAVVYITNTVPSKNIAKASSAIRDAGAALTAMVLSIRIIAKTVIMLGKEDDAKVQKGLKVIYQIAPIVLAFGAVAALSKPGLIANAKSMGAVLLSISASFAIFSIVIKALGEIESTKLDQGLRAMAAFSAFFAVVSGVSLLAAGSAKKGTNFKTAGAMLIEIAAALVIMSAAMRVLDGIKNMDTALIGLLSSVVALGAFFAGIAWVSSIKQVKTNKFMEMAAALTVLSVAFTIMSKALLIMDGVKDMGKVVGGVITSVAALGILFGIVALASGKGGKQGEGLMKASLGFAALAISVGSFVKMIADAGSVFAANEGSLQQGAVALGLVVAVMGILAGLAYVSGDAMKTFGLGILALGAGIALVAASFFIFYQTMVLLAAESALFGGAIGDMIEGFLDKFIALGPKLSSAIAMIFKAIANGIAESVIEIVNAVVKIVEEVGKNIDKILTILAPILDKIINFIVGRVEYLITLLQPLVEGIVNHILYMFNAILVPGVLTGAQTLLDWVLGNIPVIAEAIISTVEMIVNRVLALLDVLVNSESGLLAIIRRALMGENGVLTIIDEFIHALLESIRGIATDLIDTLVYLMQELVRGVLDNIDIILTGVENAINLVVEHIVSLTDTVLGGIVDVIEGIAAAIENHGSNIWKAIWHVVKAIWNSFWGIFNGDGENSISSLAGNIMEGLGEGIKKFVGKVTTKIQEIGSTIVEKFKSVFGIASPSKVMAEIGNYLDLGLAEGITDNTKPIFTGISGIGDGVIDSLKTTFLGDDASNITGLFGNNLSNSLTDALGGITDVLETDDFTPTITPVLDLSEIQNGASMIPGMINPDAGYTVNTAMVARSAYSPYEHYDGTEKTNVSEAQLDYFEMLKAKMDEVVNKFGNAKVVLDTGAVVGGIVGPMDMALGQRMAQVGRGVYSSTR